MRRTILTAAIMLGGCFGSESESHDDTLDPIPLLIQTDLDVPPLFTAIRAEGEEWVQVPFDGTGRFEIQIGGAYELFYVCNDAGRTWTQLIFSMTADGLSRTIGCVPIAGPAPVVTVSGQMQQPGRVAVGPFARQSTSGPWTWSMQVPRGVYDLVAHDGDRVVVQRGMEIEDDASMPAIDLTGGAAFVKTRMRFTGVLGDEAVSTRTVLITQSGLTSFEFDGDVVRELPAELVTANDITGTIASADSLYTHRDVVVTSLPDVFFPTRLEGIELGDSIARWDALPAGSDAWFRVTSENVDVLAVATARWLVGRHSMRFDFGIEGYRDEWKVSPTSARRRELSVEVGSASTSYGYDVLAQ